MSFANDDKVLKKLARDQLVTADRANKLYARIQADVDDLMLKIAGVAEKEGWTEEETVEAVRSSYGEMSEWYEEFLEEDE